MADVARYAVGAARLTRVSYFDIALDPDAVGLTADDLAAARDWAEPTWSTAEDQVLVGQALWVIESEGRVIVVDPCGASDPFLRTGPEAIGHQEAALAAMADAGFSPEVVDLVVLTHLDGIGMTAVVDGEGRWSAAFPRARIVLTASELAFLEARGDASGIEVLRDLIDQGTVDGVADDEAFTDEVAFRHTGGHSDGHAVVEVRSRGERATLVGHLALNPIQVAVGARPGFHVDDEAGHRALHEILDAAEEDGALVIGPLWPYPGAGTVAAGGQRVAPAAVAPLAF